MGAIKLTKAADIAELIDVVDKLLPLNSVYGCAEKVRLGIFWKKGNSKRESIAHLLRGVYEFSPVNFPALVEEMLRVAIVHKENNQSPVDRYAIEAIAGIMKSLGFRTGELSKLSRKLSTSVSNPANKKISPVTSLADLKKEYDRLGDFIPQRGGYLFQDFLYKLLMFYGLRPNKPFQNTGEEVDGSFKLGPITYLFEAKRQHVKTGLRELRILQGAVQTKGQGTRGIFFSVAGFTEPALKGISIGQQICIVGIDSSDLELILSGEFSLIDAIEEKWREAAESNNFYISLSELPKRE
jgi:hypothetical protein